jgi:hypothetical protein
MKINFFNYNHFIDYIVLIHPQKENFEWRIGLLKESEKD